MSKSRWGTLLSGAVAGLESRLDTILAEGSDGAAAQTTQAAPSKAGALASASRSKGAEGKTLQQGTLPDLAFYMIPSSSTSEKEPCW